MSSTTIDNLIDKHYADVRYGQRALEDTIQQAIDSGLGGRVLDAGCGWDALLTRKYSSQATVVGVDLSSTLPADLYAIRADLSALPFRDETFSLVYSRSVFEHLTHPDKVLDEFGRVLRKGGWCVILTPNAFDYSSVVAAATPQKFHQWFIGRVYGSAAEYDTFPVLYRANTPTYYRRFVRRRSLWKLRQLSGLRHYPANLMFSPVLFRLGIGYDWFVDRLRLVALQPSLLVVLEKAQ